MADRRPTDKQAVLLRAVADGKATAHPDFRSGTGYRLDGKAATAAVRALVSNGWAEHDDGIGTLAEPTPRTLRLTRYGEALLRDADELAEYNLTPDSEKPDVRVTRRDLGRAAVRGMGGPGVGRNVKCWTCWRAAEAAGRHIDPIVWFTNESDSSAQREALRVQVRHTLRHTRGEIGA